MAKYNSTVESEETGRKIRAFLAAHEWHDAVVACYVYSPKIMLGHVVVYNKFIKDLPPADLKRFKQEVTRFCQSHGLEPIYSN